MKPKTQMTARMIAQELGINETTAQGYLRVIAREDGIERDKRTGHARIWRGDFERRLREARLMEGRGEERRPVQLMTAQMLTHELGLPKSIAATIFKLAIRKRGPVHLPGFRRTFARRGDVERVLEGSGALR
jgi:hypothetical protein